MTQDIYSGLQSNQAFSLLLKKNYITGAAMAFRTEMCDYVLPISPIWVHDYWIAILISAISTIVLIDQPLVNYRQHETNQIALVVRCRKVDTSQK